MVILHTPYYMELGAYKAQPNHPLNFTLRAVNAHMSSLRISVKHGFGKTSNLWGFNTHGKNMKIGLSLVAGYYMVSILLAYIGAKLGIDTTAILQQLMFTFIFNSFPVAWPKSLPAYCHFSSPSLPVPQYVF